MRVLVLLDSGADLEGDWRVQSGDGLMQASARRDVATVIPRLDRSRVQPETYTLRGGRQSINARSWLDLPALRRLARLVRERDIELIHALGPRALVYTMLVGRLTGVPTMTTCYGRVPLAYDDQAGIPQVVQVVTRRVARWGLDRLVVPCELSVRGLAGVRYPKQRVELIYPGINVPDSPPPVPDRSALGLPEGPLATMIAPLTADQGYDVLMDCLPRLMQRVPGVHIAVVGMGPLLWKLQQMSHSGIPLPITWLGGRDDVQDIIRASNVIIVHPRTEGIPQVLIDAAAAARPAISSRVAGITEVIEPARTGTIVTPGDSRDLAIQIGKYLLQPAWANRIGEAAQHLARERFSLDRQCEAITTLYEGTIYASR
jgi:glycosyltransferase involved in cell wall biosynthesis